VVESFFSTLEFELLRRQTWDTPADARAAVGRYIEGLYNPRRRHWSITDGWRDILEETLLSPAELEALLANMALQLTRFAGS
jgi:hypothetical protein